MNTFGEIAVVVGDKYSGIGVASDCIGRIGRIGQIEYPSARAMIRSSDSPIFQFSDSSDRGDPCDVSDSVSDSSDSSGGYNCPRATFNCLVGSGSCGGRLSRLQD